MLKPFESFGRVSMALHWLVAFGILIMFGTAIIMEEPAAMIGDELRRLVFTVHKTTGFLILTIMLFRVFWNHFYPPPPLPLRRFPEWQAIAARFVHDALYVLAIVTPFIGWAMISVSSRTIDFYGLFQIPPLPYLNAFAGFDDFKSFISILHETLATILACLVVVHIGATFLHHFVDRDEILLRITPKVIHPLLEKIRGR